ncbi:hypothetical protein BDZ91DRAFT_383976 [Kalaharituber pfeilii]|nr:hypothetical protein BDZ91DRAFT_383976 [Kalaharituber pfeilii]
MPQVPQENVLWFKVIRSIKQSPLHPVLNCHSSSKDNNSNHRLYTKYSGSQIRTMSVCPTVIESQIRAGRIRAQEASHQTLHRVPEIQAMFPRIPLGSYFECPAELPRIETALPKIAIFQNSDILDLVIAWQRRLFPGVAPLANEMPNGTTDRVCVVNAAYDERAGGDWMSANICQEDAICRRSTLYHALITPAEGEEKQSFYPIENGGIYSPNVIIHRDGPANFYELYTTAEKCTIISVVSVPPERTPMLDEGGSYRFELERELQKTKMITALRIAARHGHKHVVIGSFGSVNREVPEYSTRRHNRGGGLGGQGPLNDERRDINPIREVAEMWAELIDGPDSEFSGYFENIVFIVGVGQKATDEAYALSKAFKLPNVARVMKEWWPGQYNFAYRD